MVIDQLLRLYDVLLLHLSHVVREILQVHVLIFPTHDVLDLIELPCGDSSEGRHADVSNLFEDEVFISQLEVNCGVCIESTSLQSLLAWIEYLVLDL